MKNYPLYEVDDFNNFRDFVEKISKKYEDFPALSGYNSKGELLTRSYNELAADVYALAEELGERGYEGKHIAIVSQNSYLMVVALFATTYIGGVSVIIDTENTPESIKSMVKFADSELVFVSETMSEGTVENGLFDGKPIVVLSEDKTTHEGILDEIDKGNGLISKRGRKFEKLEIKPRQPALILYTSGTTSTSKPAVLSHEAIISNARGSMQNVSLKKRMFTSLPFYHSYGLTCSLINNLMSGTNTCINGDIRYMIRDLMAFKPNGIMVVPLIAEALCQKLAVMSDSSCGTSRGFNAFIKKCSYGVEKPKDSLVAIKEKILPGFELMVCGGAYLSPGIAKTLRKFGILILEGYGVTECSPLISVSRNEFFKRGTAGLIIPQYEVRIEDEEILVRGKCLMNGYYKHDELTAEALSGGWFKTGDLGYFDNDGFLIINGRKKNIIVLKSGKKVSPEDLENDLIGLPLAKEIMVYGSAIGNSADDVVPALMVYPDPKDTENMTVNEILNEIQTAVDAINETLPTFKQIRIINIRDKEFEKTAKKSIKRFKV